MTEKQQRFVEEYLICGNATQAYMKAYGVSEATANASGPRLLVNVSVAAAIAEAQSERSKRVEITADAVLSELWKNAMLARSERDYNASNKALELCDKHLGTPDRLHVTTDKSQAVEELADMLGITPEDLLAFHSNEPLVS